MSLANLAEHVRTYVAGLPVATGAVIERKWIPSVDRKSLAQRHISVIGRSTEVQAYTRVRLRLKHTVDVAVQQQVTSDAEVDDLVEEMEDLAAALAVIPNTSGVSREDVSVPVTFSDEHLDELRVFTGIATVTFFGTRT